MEFALWAVILISLAAGVCGALLNSWGLRRKVYRLELDVADLQNKLLTTVKQNAAGARWDKKKLLEEAQELLKPMAAAQTHPKNPWDF